MRLLASWLRDPRACIHQERKGEAGRSFYDSLGTLELMQLHFYHILLIQAITKVHSWSRRRNIKPISQQKNVNATS